MIQKLKLILLSLSSIFLLSFALTPALANAADIQGSLCSGAQTQSLSTSAPCPTGQSSSFDTILTTIINILSVIVGIVAVIMIIVGGFRYITSGGKQESVTGAKKTILYAKIGLVIVELAQIIVKFVLNNAGNP